MIAAHTLEAPRPLPADQQSHAAQLVRAPCQATLRRRSEPDQFCRIGPPAQDVVAAFDRVVAGRKSEALLAVVALDEGQGVGAVAQLRDPVLLRGYRSRQAGFAQQLGGPNIPDKEW